MRHTDYVLTVLYESENIQFGTKYIFPFDIKNSEDMI